MMDKVKYIVAICCVLMFSQIGFASEKIGVVDIQSIVNNSSEVRALKNERSNQMECLNRIVTDAQVVFRGRGASKPENKQILPELKKEDLQPIKLVKNEPISKKEAIDREYSRKLSAIECRLNNQIAESARKNNYDYVFAKSVVFLGGDDITSLVSKDIR